MEETRTGICCAISERKKRIGRHSCRWDDNNKMDLKEIGWGGGGLDLSGPGYRQMAGVMNG